MFEFFLQCFVLAKRKDAVALTRSVIPRCVALGGVVEVESERRVSRRKSTLNAFTKKYRGEIVPLLGVTREKGSTVAA